MYIVHVRTFVKTYKLYLARTRTLYIWNFTEIHTWKYAAGGLASKHNL